MLANSQETELLVLSTPDLRAYGETTPPPLPSSSSVENTPPKSLEVLEKNQRKLSKIPNLTLKERRNLQRLFHYNKITMESATITNEIIKCMQAARAPLRRKYTKRHVKPFSSSGILTVRDSNRSIVSFHSRWDFGSSPCMQFKNKKERKGNNLHPSPLSHSPPVSPIQQRIHCRVKRINDTPSQQIHPSQQPRDHRRIHIQTQALYISPILNRFSMSSLSHTTS